MWLAPREQGVEGAPTSHATALSSPRPNADPDPQPQPQPEALSNPAWVPICYFAHLPTDQLTRALASTSQRDRTPSTCSRYT